MAKGAKRTLKIAATKSTFPAATATKRGTALQMPLQANSASAPTQTEFNALLTKLKNAGLMSTT